MTAAAGLAERCDAAGATPWPDGLVDHDSEAIVLGVMMLDNELIDDISDRLGPDDFALRLNRRIFEISVQEHMQGRPVAPHTIWPFLSDDPDMADAGGRGYLAGLTSSCVGLAGFMAVEGLVNRLSDLARRRRMADGLLAAASACGDLGTTAGEIIALADGALGSGREDGTVETTAGQAADRFVRDLCRDRRGVTCGQIPDLDRLIGDLRPKELTVCAARPGMGKTALAVSYALGAAGRGHGVLFVSLEMSEAELAGRMIADLCFDADGGIPYAALRSGRLDERQQRLAIAAASRLHALPLHIVDTSRLTPGRLNAAIRRHARRMAANGHRLDLTIVDYLQLMRPDARGRDRYADVSEVSAGLKAAAKANSVAIMALAQLNREVDKRSDRRPQLSDLRDSGQIEQDADHVLFLLRDEYYLRQAEPDLLSDDRAGWEAAMQKVQGMIEFILAKARNGTPGHAFGRFHGAFQAVR